MPLHLDYRPQTLDEVWGNDNLLITLRGVLAKPEKERPKVYLLAGGSGMGKTTLARIIADMVGSKGSDITEVNAANSRGVDTIREITVHTRLAPFESKCRVWILDECARFTTDSQSALLKLLEDTPKNCYFILCTTDDQKLLTAIRNRCSQYRVEPLSDKLMGQFLKEVTKSEKNTITEDVLKQIVDDSLGSPRMALQILEQVLATPKDKRLVIARETAAIQSEVINLCRILIDKRKWDWVAISTVLKGLKDKGEDPEGVRRAILGYCQSVLLSGKYDTTTLHIMECMKDNFYNTAFPGLVLACATVIFQSYET